jgi:hypothetical protein
MVSRLLLTLVLSFHWNFSIPSDGLFLNQTSGDEGLVMIGNKTGFTGMSWKQARSVFKGERLFWADGTPVTVVLPGNGLSYSTDVASKVYGTNPSGMQKYWLSLVFQGRGKPPVFFNSEEEIILYISQNKGAVAFVTAASKSRCNDFIISLSDK